MANLLVGLALGILGSFVAWVVVAHLLTPKVAIGEVIERRTRIDGTTYYRFEIGNARAWRRADDVSVTARFDVRRTRPSGAVVTSWFNVPVDDVWIPSLIPRRRRKS